MHIRHVFYSTLAFCLGIVALSGCGDESIPDSGQSVSNATYGMSRANNYSRVGVPAPGYLTELRFDSLETGFLGIPLPVNYDHVAVITGDRRLALIRYDNVVWTWQFGEEEYPLPELACDDAGTIYAVTTNQHIVAVDSGGDLRWKKSLQADDTEQNFDLPTAPVSVSDGMIAGTSGGVLKKFDRSGAELWSRKFGADLMRTVSYSATVGTVCGLTHNDYALSDTLVVLNDNGSIKWDAPLPGTRIESGPIIVGDHVVVGLAAKNEEGKYLPYLLSLDAQGKELWRASLSIPPIGLAGDDEGNVYVSGGGGSRMGGGIVSSFSMKGEERWEITLAESIPSKPVISSEWVFFVAFRGQTLGLYTYRRGGEFAMFTPINARSDINPVPVILPYGSLVITGTDEPVFLQNASRGIFDLL